MTDRDTFAAAALTGLLSNVQRYQNEPLTRQAYEIADFMLRERGVTKPLPKEKRAEVSDGSYLKTDENRGDSDTNRGTAKPQNGVPDEPVAWAVRYTHADTGIVDLCRTLEDCRRNWSNRTSDSWRYVPLYHAPTLTDEEREAIKMATDFLEDEFYGCSDKCAVEHNAVATLRNLLERLK